MHLLIPQILPLAVLSLTSAFAPQTSFRPTRLSAVSDKVDVEETLNTFQAVRAPLKYVGPYPCLALRFPDLATSNQRLRNETGVSLDFVVDTAANTNTLAGSVAQELELSVVGSALPGVGAAGVLEGGDTYLLGDAQLEGQEPIFIKGLTASTLPIASPASAGLLSLAFLQSFDAVEFTWGTVKDNKVVRIPSITFYGGELPEAVLQGRTRVTLDRVPVTQLPTVNLSVNGATFPALLDTGSPVTVMNAQAARIAGIETAVSSETPNNPLAAAAQNIQKARAASKGDVLTVATGIGARVDLFKSANPVSFQLAGGNVDFGDVQVFVGDLPGLAALNGLGIESPPAVVLGMDVLRQRPSMLLRAQHNDVWFD